jgi:hypothetical protein
MPSAKYSWSFFSLMSTNGRTATDFSGIANAADTVVCVADATVGAGGASPRSTGCHDL